MAKFIRRAVLGGVAVAAVFASGALAWAEGTKLRVAYFLADSMLPALYAQDKGCFAEAGLDPEFIAVQGGPAVVAAIASGEADIGYAAPVPPINGRLNGVPVKMFLQLAQEVDPDKKYTWLVASGASGITDLAGVKGKKIAFNANGGLCELMWRDHLASVGLTIDAGGIGKGLAADLAVDLALRSGADGAGLLRRGDRDLRIGWGLRRSSDPIPAWNRPRLPSPPRAPSDRRCRSSADRASRAPVPWSLRYRC